MDKLTTLKTFHTVVKHRSFSQAAIELNTSPQLVSKYISALEKSLGIRLINRTTRRLNLTSEGAEYYEESLKITDALDVLESRITDLQLRPSGLLRISAPVSLGTEFLGAMVARFIQQHPGVSVDIQLNDRKVDIIDEGFDLALRIGALMDSSLIARPLAQVDVLACASPAYLREHGAPATQDDLHQHQLLRYSYLEQDASHSDTRVPITSNSGELLAKAAAAGAGVVISPRYIVQHGLAQGDLVELFVLPNPAGLGLFAVYPHRTMLPLKLRVFVDFLADQFRDCTL